jgi:predicted RNA binding protein YcfA (HicA-like mRNA interferase family)
MKVSELRRMLEKEGWYIDRNGANYDLYKHPDRPDDVPIAVSRHMSQEIKKYSAVNT